MGAGGFTGPADTDQKPTTNSTAWRDFNDAADPFDWETIDLRAQRDEIKARLLANLLPFLRWIFPNGVVKGRKFYVGNLRGDPGRSLEVEIEGEKAGVFIDRANGDSGDIFHILAHHEGLDVKREFRKVLAAAARWLGSDWLALYIEPPPRKVNGKAALDDLGMYTAKWDYLSAEGKPIVCVYRYDLSTGKTYRPRDLVRGVAGTPNPRPLYNLPGLREAQEVVLVEGEKCAQALIDIGICATTTMSGAQAPVGKTDWSPLQGRAILIWPDKDKPGWEYAEAAAGACVAAGASSVTVLLPPEEKRGKWDAADAIAEGFDVQAFIANAERRPLESKPAPLPSFTLGALLDDDSPVPPDLIAPRVLTPAGLLVFGGAPKVGKSDFLLAWLTYMAAGSAFLGMQPWRPLRVFYLQAEMQYHYLRERVKQIPLPSSRLGDARVNFVATPQLRLILDDEGLAKVIPVVAAAFGGEPPDILAIDPLRNVFDGGDSGDENNNAAMLHFLAEQVERLRDAVNPEAGVILTHHTKKLGKKLFEEDPFQALCGAGALRGYYTSGMLLYRPDETRTTRQLIFELRNGEAIPTKHVDKINGVWREVRADARLVMQTPGERCDAERLRKREVILQILFEQAAEGRCYIANQFAEAFESKAGLGSERTIRERISVLATQGCIKFFRNASDYGLPPARYTKFGYLCVEGMVLRLPTCAPDPLTGHPVFHDQPVLPTHFKCPRTGAALPVENPVIWVYQEELET